MAAPTAITALLALTQIMSGDPQISLEDRLRSAGWDEQEPGGGSLHRRWRNDETTAVQFGSAPDAFLEVTIEMANPDFEDEESEDRLTEDFEVRFERYLADAVDSLGAPAFSGEYGDDGFPEEVDAVMVAQWSMKSGSVALNFKHEDAGVPFRITVTAQ